MTAKFINNMTLRTGSLISSYDKRTLAAISEHTIVKSIFL